MSRLRRPFVIGCVFKVVKNCEIDRPTYYPGGCYSFETKELEVGTIIRYSGERNIGSDSCYEEVFEVITGPNKNFVGALPNSWGSTHDDLLEHLDIPRHPDAK